MFRQFHHEFFIIPIVHTKGFCCDDYFRPGLLQHCNFFCNFLTGRCRISRLHKGMDCFQFLPRGQRNISHIADLFNPSGLQPAAHGQYPGHSHISFQKGIGSLGSPMGDKHNFMGSDSVTFHNIPEHLNDSFRHAFFCVVGRRNFFPGNDFTGFIINGYRIRKGSPHVDANPYPFHDGPPCVNAT